MRLLTLIACALLASCVTTQGDLVNRQYLPAHDHYKIDVMDTGLLGEQLEVHMNPTDQNRAMVRPTFSNRVNLMTAYQSEWMMRLDEFKMVYSLALHDALERQGRQCNVVSADPYPAQMMMMEFAFTCD